jgi:hypothetical protein
MFNQVIFADYPVPYQIGVKDLDQLLGLFLLPYSHDVLLDRAVLGK